MRIKNKSYLLKILILNFALLACSFVTRAIPVTATPSPTATQTHTPTSIPTIKITSTPFYPVKAGKLIFAPSGGFSFPQIQGYKISYAFYFGAQLKSLDKNVEVMASAYPRPRGIAITGVIANWRESFGEKFTDVAYADTVKMKINGIDSVFNDFSGVKNNIPFQGRFAIYEPPDAKLIYLYVIAYGDQRWQREGEKAFDIVSENIKVFPIAPMATCPISKDTKYGYLQTAPIKIGGGREDGIGRIYDYLGVLLGVKGEIVSYAHSTPVTQNGAELEVFSIRVGNDYDALYFDVNNYEELLVPYRLTCSAPMPKKPSGSSF